MEDLHLLYPHYSDGSIFPCLHIVVNQPGYGTSLIREIRLFVVCKGFLIGKQNFNRNETDLLILSMHANKDAHTEHFGPNT